jgi:hypothetical protein
MVRVSWEDRVEAHEAGDDGSGLAALGAVIAEGDSGGCSWKLGAEGIEAAVSALRLKSESVFGYQRLRGRPGWNYCIRKEHGEGVWV